MVRQTLEGHIQDGGLTLGIRDANLEKRLGPRHDCPSVAGRCKLETLSRRSHPARG
jgi:hypothetical protein